MEKIYMEDNNSRKTRRGFDFSVVLSFTVAIFAIFSIATYGIFSFQGTSVSYAAPISDETQFTFMHANAQDDSGSNADRIVSFYVSPTGRKALQVPLFLANDASNYSNMVFCVEHNVDPPSHKTIACKDGVIDDSGLLYILSSSYSNNGSGVTNLPDNEDKKYVEAFVTQVSIWLYLYETKPTATRNGVYGLYDDNGTLDSSTLHDNVKVNYITQDELDVIMNTTTLDLQTNNGSRTIYDGDNIYNSYIRPLVNQAKAASAQKQFYITYNDQDKATITDDNKFYDSPLINVVGVPSGDLISYDVSLSGIEGAFLVDENKQEMSSTGIAPGKSFYVRFPVEKAPTEGVIKNLTIHAVGHFNTLTGNYFLAENNGVAYQKVITVTGATKDIADDEVIPFTGSGDTGMNAAQTVYFIGLIVLLCGVGIVYANAKPVEVKQQ